MKTLFYYLKSYLLLIVLAAGLLFHSGYALAQIPNGWNIPTNPTFNDPTAIHVVDGDLFENTTVYTGHFDGKIRKSQDGGSTWSLQNSGVTTWINDIFFRQSKGWAVGLSNKVLRTTNGGTTWTSSTIAGATYLLGVVFSTDNIGWVVGSGGKIYKSTDGGATWTQQVSNTTQDLNGVDGGGNIIMAVGENGVVCRTTDGVNWTATTVVPEDLKAIDMNGVTGYLVGSNGRILKTVNDGANWTGETSGTTATLNSVTYNGSMALACGTSGTIIKTTGSATWSVSPHSRAGDVFRAIANRSHGIFENARDQAWVGSSVAFMRTVTASFNDCTVPTVTMQSYNIVACVGSTVSIVSQSSGTVSKRAWKKGGGIIGLNDANGSTLVFANADANVTGAYTLELTSPCGTVTSAVVNVTITTPQVPSAIIGTGTPFLNTATTYSVSPIAGATFNWNPGSGGTVTGAGNSVQIAWSTIGSKTISVTATDACGISIAQTKSITVSSCSLPAQPTFNPAAITTACVGQTSNFVVNSASGVSYAWTVSGGGTISGSGNSANVNWTSIGSHTVTVTPSNGCGNGTARTATVVVSAAPAQPSTITGNVSVCTGVATSYSVTNVAGVTYAWSTGGGGTVTGSGNAISVTWTSGGSKTLMVTPSTSCGVGAPRTVAVTVNTVPSQPSVIAGSTSVATGTSNQFSVTNEAGTTYAWNAGTGGTVTGSGNSVNISWSSAGSKTITLTPSNSCGNGTARTLNVMVNDCAAPAQPSTITGSTTGCTTASGVYSVTNVGGVTYSWNAGTDGFVSGSGNSVTLSWTSVGTKTVTVTPSNACGNGTARTLVVTVSQLPAQPSTITGNITPCKNASLGYSVTNVAGVSYTWDIIGTGTITGSGNSITVNWTATGSHTLRVTPSNACGAGVARTLDVVVNDVPLAASQMAGLTAVCSGITVPYSVGNLTGVNYTWSAGSGSTITGSTSSVTISWSTGGTKTVTVTPSNACGNGTASTKTVEVSTTPAQPSTIVGSTAAVGGVAQSYSVTNVPGVTYTWSTNADGVIANSGNTAQVTWATAGAKTLTVTPSNLCGNGTARTLNVTTTVPCTIPGTPSSMTIGLGGSTNIVLNDFRRFVVGASSGSTSLNISVSPSAGTTITPVFGNTWDIVFTIPGTYTISGFGEISGCGAGAPANTTVEVCTGTVSTPTAISGPLTDVCRGTTTRYSVTPVSGVVFDWSLSSFSGTITYLNADRSMVDIAWSTANVGADNINVKAKNACNVQSSNFTETVFFKGKPSYAGFGLSLSGSICAGSGGTLNMNIGLPEAATTYTWQLNGAGTIAGDNLSATALADGVSRQIKIYGTNACFKDELIDAIDYAGGTPVPVTPSPVSGPSTIDFNTVGTYSVEAQPAGVNFSWDAGSDATITAGASANIKNIQWSTGGLKTVFVNAVNTCGDGYRSYSVFVNGPCVAPSVPGTISGETTVCAGVEYQYSVPFQNFDTFNWSAGADATITGSGGIRTIKWSTGGAKTISVTATNLCTTSAAQTLAVTVNTIPAQPATLTGSTSGCNGATQQISLASPVGGVTYTWEVQGGTVVTSGAQAQIADITWTSLGVNEVKLKPSNACGNGTPRTLSVTVGSVPDQPSLITGESEVCSATSKTYSITNVPGVTYAWNAGSGGTVTGSGNSVSISWSTTGSKTVTVTPSNSCGNGTARMLTVNVKGVPAQPATIVGVASPTLGNEEAYSVTSVAGVNYTWSLSAMGTLSGNGNGASVYWSSPGSATLSVTPSNACGNGTARTASITVNKINQSIAFTVTSPMLANQALTLNGEATSGLPVSYASSDNSVAEILGRELIIKSYGVINITASQAGDATFAAASNVVRSLTINKANQAITFNALSPVVFNTGGIELTGTTDSGLPITYGSSNTSVATISGDELTIVGAGTADITATQGGSAIYNSATPVVRALTVNKADQTISFDPLAVKGVSDPPFSLSATSSSGLEVSYSSSNTSVATVSGNTVTLVGIGQTTITATQSGNANYLPASGVTQTLTVNGKQGQTITFGALAAKTFGDANFTLSATSSSGLPVSFTSSNTNVATINGNNVTIVGAGAATITASQSGDDAFNQAPSVTQELVVNKAAQTITFNPLTNQKINDATLALNATASSGLAIVYSSSNEAVATLSGSTVSFLAVGTTTITATQPGNENYLAATAVDQTLVITAKEDQSITFYALPDKTYGDGAFELAATASSSLPVSYASSNTQVATVSGSTVTIIGAGTTTITASQAGNADFNAAAMVSQTLFVDKASQTITFEALAESGLTQGAFNVSASASSGLSVTFESSNTAVATVSGNTVTPLAAGTTVIRAMQNGNDNYFAAADVLQTLVVVDDTPTRIISLAGTLVFGDAILPESKTATLTISNSGNAALTISQITFPAGFTGTPVSGSVSAGGSLSVAVTFAPTEVKEYSGEVVVTSNATSGTNTIAVSGKGISVTALEDAVGLRTLRVFPNPSHSIITIEVKNPLSQEVHVMDETGRMTMPLTMEPLGNDLHRVDISSLAAGVYYLRLPGDRTIRMARIVKIN